MKQTPFFNALAALGYIIVVASIMYYGPQLVQVEESLLLPIAVLSLFVLSATVMGFLFLFQPGQLYFDGQKKEAINFFLKTVTAFAGLTFLVFFIVLISSIVF